MMGRMGGKGRLLLVLLLAGCSETGSSAARTRVFDSAGVTIVENSDAHAPDIAAWSVDSVPILRIGREDGPDAYRIDGVRGIARLSDSTIVIAEGSPSIRFFDEHGQFLHAVGRRGDGPGEYRVISMMRRIDGGSLLAWDFATRRVTVLAPDGAFVRSERGPVTAGWFFAMDVFTDGSLLGSHDPPLTGARPPSGILSVATAMVRFTPSSGVMDTLTQIAIPASFVSGGEHFAITDMPFHAEPLGVVTGAAAYLGNSAQFCIGYYNGDGRLTRLTRLDRTAMPLEPSIRDAYIAHQFARARTSADSERIKVLYSEIPFPKTMPAVSSLAVDGDSNLWVRTYSISDSVASRWTIFDPDGQLLAEAEAPAHFAVFRIGKTDIIGTHEDSLGVQQVQVLRLRKPE